MWYAKNRAQRPIPSSVEAAIKRVNAIPDLFLRIESQAALARELRQDQEYVQALKLFILASDSINSTVASLGPNTPFTPPSFWYILYDTAKCYERMGMDERALSLYSKLSFPGSPIFNVDIEHYACKMKLIHRALGYIHLIETQLQTVRGLLAEVPHRSAQESEELMARIHRLIQGAPINPRVPIITLFNLMVAVRNYELLLGMKLDGVDQLDIKIQQACKDLAEIRETRGLGSSPSPCLL